MQRHQQLIERQGTIPLTTECRLAHQGHLGGSHVVGYRDHPVTTPQHEITSSRIISAIEPEIDATCFTERYKPVEIPGRILEATNTILVRQSRHCGRLQITSGATRHIIENLRQTTSLTYGGKVTI